MHVAAHAGRLESIQFLFEHGARLEDRNTSGNTPLALAAMLDRPSAIVKLHALGADLDARNNVGDIDLSALP
jgi:ankyrin repeat protein